jgi:uncharacterized repeat protein (TIGR01451 family)
MAHIRPRPLVAALIATLLIGSQLPGSTLNAWERLTQADTTSAQAASCSPLSLRVHFTDIKNSPSTYFAQLNPTYPHGHTDLQPSVTLPDGTVYADNQAIPLTNADGSAIVDPAFASSAPGFRVKRGNGFVMLSLYGHQRANVDLMSADGTATIDGTTFNRFEQAQGLDGLESSNPTTGEYPFSESNKYAGGWFRGAGHNDKAVWSPGSATVDFSYGVSANEDTAYFFYDTSGAGCAASSSSSSVSSAPLPQCSDGMDNDGDGKIDAQDPGCYTNGYYNPNDNDETNQAQSSSSSSSSSQGTPVLDIQKTDNRTTIQPNETDTYVITVQNQSDIPAYFGNYYSDHIGVYGSMPMPQTTFFVTDFLPQGVTFLSASDGGYENSGQVIWNDFMIPAHGVKQLQVLIRVNGNVQNGTQLINNAILSNGRRATDTTIVLGASSSSSSVSHAQCSDGMDNDGDGKIDAQDPGCYTNGYYNPNDNDETDTYVPQCRDGMDNDGDGLVDAQDPGCYTNGYYNPNDNDEHNQTQSSSSSVYHPQCSDGFDNDGDGKIDAQDPGCYTNGYYNPNDNDEWNAQSSSSSSVYHAQCSDGQDNDGDGLTDAQDPGCYTNGYYNPNDNDETNANVQLQLSIAAPAETQQGQTIPVTLTSRNTDGGTATNATLTYYLPFGTTYVGGDSRCAWQGDSVVCNLGTLAPGQTLPVTLQIQTGGNGVCVPSTLIHTATLRADQSSANAAAATASTTLQCPNAQLLLEKTDNRSTAAPGDTLVYTITVRNTSSVQASNVQVTDGLPGQLSFVSASDAGYVSGQSVTWSGLTVPAYGTRTLTVTARISGSIGPCVIINTARIDGNGVPVSASDSTVVLSAPAPLPPPVYGGTGGGYAFAENNAGQAAMQSNTSVVNAPVQGDNNTVAITTVQQNQNQQYLIAEQEAVAANEVNTLTSLPKTGAGDRTGPLENASRFLLPVSAGQAGTSAAVWGSMLLTMLGSAGWMIRRAL